MLGAKVITKYAQACRGEESDPEPNQPVPSAPPHSLGETQTDSGAVPIVASTGRPMKSDYVIASSTIPEHVAFRSTTMGSFYIRHLCKVGGREWVSVTLVPRSSKTGATLTMWRTSSPWSTTRFIALMQFRCCAGFGVQPALPKRSRVHHDAQQEVPAAEDKGQHREVGVMDERVKN